MYEIEKMYKYAEYGSELKKNWNGYLNNCALILN